MIRSLIASALTSLTLLAPQTTGLAPSATAKDAVRASFVKDRPATVDMTRDGIRVAGYRFDRITRGGSNPFKMGAGPTVIFNVRNEGLAGKDFAIAVALFDQNGRLVGAGSGSPVGKLGAGDTDEVKVVFNGLSRDVHRATTMYLTLETER